MTLAYRSIFTAVGDQNDVEDLILEQFNEWLKKDPVRQPRNLDRDLYKLNAVTVFNSGTELIYFEHKSQDGNRTLRARLIENKDNGRWISTLTLFFPKKFANETVVMYEGDSPSEVDRFGMRRPLWVGRPGLVRRILEVVDARDVITPSIKLLMRPEVIVDPLEAEHLFDSLCDPERRISLLIAASKAGEIPNSKLEVVDNLMHDALGTASAFILSPEVTRAFNKLVGTDHGVWYDNLRLYVPDFDPAVALNARIHPIIKRYQLENQNLAKTAKFVGFIARRELTEKPMKFLKRDLARVETALVDREYELLIAGEKVIASKNSVNQHNVTVNPPLTNTSVDTKILGKIKSALSLQEIDDNVLSAIAERYQGYSLISDRLLATKLESREAEFKLEIMQEDLDDAILLHAEVYEENKKLRDQVKFLRKEIMISDRRENAWLETPSEIQNKEPVSFEEIFERFDEFQYLVFTGDKSIATELDVTELGARAGATWNELSGLNDYCKAKAGNLVRGGIMQYIDNLPNDFNPITKKNFRGSESESVERNPELRNQRFFNVPFDVHESGKVYMFSHITIGKRLHIHFFDDFAKTSKIYIGRIGSHLDTASTN